MIQKHKLLRAGLGSLMLAFLLSCGGGSDVGGGSVSGNFAGDGFTLGGSSGGGSNGDGTGGDGGSSSSASTGGDGSTSTAGNGNGDGSGVGSGGTGVSTADAGTSVGSVDGMGSIIVGGVRYDIDQLDKLDPQQWTLEDASDLQLGMTLVATGPVDSAFANGKALKLKSMAQMRGSVGVVDVPGGSFQMLGSTVSVDDDTVWADLPGLAGLVAGTQVQVWALPVSPGVLRATRIESQGAAVATLVTGVVTLLDPGNRTFQLGGLVVDYRSATLPLEGLADGRIVRVAASSPPVGSRLDASEVEGWYALSTVRDAPVQIEGVITDYVSKGSFKMMGLTIDASGVQQVTGGQESKLGNGVKVVAGGKLSSGGVLVASKLKIRHIPGGGALPSYDLHGTIGNYVSPSDMKVRGQQVNVSAVPNIDTSQLANGVKVWVRGTQVIEGVLQVTELTYE